jgi:nucleotide-binding universal stress UspA family protein
MRPLYEKILIPLDGSPLAERIFPHLARLALPAETELHLVSVLEAWRYALGSADLAYADLVTYLRDDLHNYLAQQAQILRAVGYRVSTHCREGDAALTIVDIADTIGAQLIAMTTHGRSGLRRWALGSVAERILQATTLPVFLVRDETATTAALQRLLVPLDGSVLAEDALPQAVHLAKNTGATVLLLAVIQALDPTNQQLFFRTTAAAEQAMQQWTTESRDYLESVGQRLLDQGILYETYVRTGDPDQEICAMTTEAAVDLLVMSTHGRTGFNRWVYGSVANKVLRNACCPMLLARSAVHNGGWTRDEGRRTIDN